MLATQSVFRPRIEAEGAREPADRDQPGEARLAPPRGELDHGDGVLRAVGDVERFPVRGEGEGVGRGAEEIGRARLGPDRLDDASVAGVDDAQVVGGGVGADEVAAVGRQRQGRRVEPAMISGPDVARREVDDADRTFAGDVSDRIDPDRCRGRRAR